MKSTSVVRASFQLAHRTRWLLVFLAVAAEASGGEDAAASPAAAAAEGKETTAAVNASAAAKAAAVAGPNPLKEIEEKLCAALKSLGTINVTAHNAVTATKSSLATALHNLEEVREAHGRTESFAIAARRDGEGVVAASAAVESAEAAVLNATEALEEAEEAHSAAAAIDSSAGSEAYEAQLGAHTAVVTMLPLLEKTRATAGAGADAANCTASAGDPPLTSAGLDDFMRRLEEVGDLYGDDHDALKELWMERYFSLFVSLGQLQILLEKLEWDVSATAELAMNLTEAVHKATEARLAAESASKTASEEKARSLRPRWKPGRFTKREANYQTVDGPSFHEEPPSDDNHMSRAGKKMGEEEEDEEGEEEEDEADLESDGGICYGLEGYSLVLLLMLAGNAGVSAPSRHIT